jgi:hypothetical protein
MFGRKKRIEALEAKVAVLQEQFDEVVKYYSKQNAARETRVEALETKVAELEAKRVPVISDLTGGGKKEKPVSAKQIMDEWFNGKAEGGEGK